MDHEEGLLAVGLQQKPVVSQPNGSKMEDNVDIGNRPQVPMPASVPMPSGQASELMVAMPNSPIKGRPNYIVNWFNYG